MNPLQPLNFDRAVLPATPGRNAGAATLTRAGSDREAVSEWLERYLESPQTWISYRREAERLLLWCDSRGQGIQDLTVADMTAFQAWLKAPQPAATWCVLHPGAPEKSQQRPARTLADGSPNPAWRPFMTGLSASTAALATRIIFNLFEYLCGVGYLAANPLRAARTKRRQANKPEVERYLERPIWDLVKAYLSRLPRDTAREEAHFQRNYFLLGWMYLTGLRISEMAACRTEHIRLKRGKYWLRVTGKGAKTADIPLTNDALELLKTYRESLGREPLPGPDLSEPVIMDICGKGRPLTVKAIDHIVKSVFVGAAETADSHGRHALELASAHWLRHSYASHALADGVPLKVVQENLRHASISTTSQYLHADKDAQHEASQGHRL